MGFKKYGFQVFNPSSSQGFPGGNFEDIDPIQIDPNKKTLLLLHGTFSTTVKSFGDLCNTFPSKDLNINNKSLLQYLIKNKTYDQIIGFDHPTASHSVKQNVDVLLSLLSDVRFSHPVDIITTSRGALVAEWLSASKFGARHFQFRKIMTFAPSHGSDLLTAAKGIDKFLSILKTVTTKTGWGVF